MSKVTSRVLQIPSNLDLDKLILELPYKKNASLTVDKLAFVCHDILHLIKQQQKRLDKQNGFVHLYAQHLKQLIPDYHVILKYLLETDVIFTDNCYIKNIRSKGYKFSTFYSGETQQYKIRTKSFNKHLNSICSNLEFKKAIRLSKSSHLHQWFNKDLHIDKKKALQWINDFYSQSEIEFENACLTKKQYENKIEILNIQVESYRELVSTFDERKFRYSVDGTSNRFHSILTNLKKELRNFVRYKNSKLNSVDLKTSQFFLSLVLFNPSFYNSRESKNALTLKKLHPKLYQTIKANGDLVKLKKIAKDCNKISTHLLDIQNYKRDILEKDFYDCLSNDINEKNPEFIVTRDIVKKKLLYIIFNDWDNKKYSDIYHNAFYRKYPTVNYVFSIFKKREHRDFPILLQRIESELILYKISKKFSCIYPDAPIYSIHDSLVTTTKYKQQLNNIMISELSKLTSATPKLKEERWSPENANVNVEINVNDTNMMII